MAPRVAPTLAPEPVPSLLAQFTTLLAVFATRWGGIRHNHLMVQAQKKKNTIKSTLHTVKKVWHGGCNQVCNGKAH
jgi:hypothetical protein